jgi:hypothetical protein
MAKTRERKLEVARAIFDICVGEYGLAPGDLIYDALTFTLATGDPEWIESAKETIEGFRLIKARAPRGLHDPRRLERELRAHPRGARGAQLGASCTTAWGGARRVGS